MKLDTKYFIPFLAILAVTTALLITFFTINSQKTQQRAFEKVIVQQDSLTNERMPVLGAQDSVSVNQFAGRYVILDFWATWSNFSEDAHYRMEKLVQQHPKRLQVIAAVVEDQKEKIDSYMQRHSFPFVFAEGTTVFNQYHVPGMPTQLVYNPSGKIIDVYFGYTDSTQFDSLKILLNEQQ